MRKITTPVIALVALFCLSFFAACSQQKGSSEKEPGRQPENTTAQQSGPEGQASQQSQLSGDKQFIAEAAQDGRAEVQLAQLALKKASNPEVKRFAQKLVADHTKANKELESLPQASEALQSGSSSESSSETEQFANLSGKEFDRTFVEHAVQDHEKAVSRFQEAASSAQDPQVKQFATQTLPVLQRHLEMAKSLQSKLSRGAAAGGQ